MDVPARSYRAIVQYDGTAYYGFQRQRQALDGTGVSIQSELEGALAKLAGRAVTVTGAGRTDTGVHALGQVIGFTIEWPERRGTKALMHALNAHLPRDIAIRDLDEAPPGFHPRFDARRRTYEYAVLSTFVRHPLWRHRAWLVMEPLDVAPMNEAAGLLAGEQDFATFGRAPVGENTVREVHEVGWRVAKWQDDELLIFRITANAFLYRMVRSLVGSLRMVGAGRWSVDRFADALRACDRSASADAAPAHGLYLMRVEYDPPWLVNLKDIQ
jgi:tRNA pseudouridine38-40 synthase